MTFTTPTVPGVDAPTAARWRDGIEAEVRRRRRGRVRVAAVSGSAVLAGGAVTVALVLASPGVSYAFGGWTATPTPKTAAELIASADPCAGAPPNIADVGAPTASVVDTRGPFTLSYYVASAATGYADLTCVTGPAFAHPAVALGRGSAQSAPTPGFGHIDFQTAMPGSADGQTYTIVTGSVGSGVSAVSFNLSDGSTVVATVGDGLLVAWWPGDATITSTQATISD